MQVQRWHVYVIAALLIVTFGMCAAFGYTAGRQQWTSDQHATETAGPRSATATASVAIATALAKTPTAQPQAKAMDDYLVEFNETIVYLNSFANDPNTDPVVLKTAQDGIEELEAVRYICWVLQQ